MCKVGVKPFLLSFILSIFICFPVFATTGPVAPNGTQYYINTSGSMPNLVIASVGARFYFVGSDLRCDKSSTLYWANGSTWSIDHAVSANTRICDKTTITSSTGDLPIYNDNTFTTTFYSPAPSGPYVVGNVKNPVRSHVNTPFTFVQIQPTGTQGKVMYIQYDFDYMYGDQKIVKHWFDATHTFYWFQAELNGELGVQLGVGAKIKEQDMCMTEPCNYGETPVWGAWSGLNSGKEFRTTDLLNGSNLYGFTFTGELYDTDGITKIYSNPNFVPPVPGDGGPGNPSDYGEAPIKDSYSDIEPIKTVRWGFDTLVYYILLPFKMLATVLTSFLGAIGGVVSGFTNVKSFMTSVFGFLPAPALGLLTVSFGFLSLGLILRMFGRK